MIPDIEQALRDAEREADEVVTETLQSMAAWLIEIGCPPDELLEQMSPLVQIVLEERELARDRMRAIVAHRHAGETVH